MRLPLLLSSLLLLAACAEAPVAPVPYETAHQTFVQGDIKLAVQQLMPLASDGDIRALRDLGIIYTGDTLHYDFDKGRQLLEMAATRGDARAQFAYARLYGAPSQSANFRSAHGWYQKAADQGLPEAEAQVGVDWLMGYGGLVNDEVALGWLQKAADAGDPAGIGYLAQVYLYGMGGVKQDQARGMEFYQQAAKAGDRRSDLFLAICYRRGECGMPMDAHIAESYYEQASEVPFKDALDMAEGMKATVDAHKVYPKGAITAKQTGLVMLEFDADGSRATNVKVTQSSGFLLLDAAARQAVLDSTFPRRGPWLAGYHHFKVGVNFSLDAPSPPAGP